MELVTTSILLWQIRRSAYVEFYILNELRCVPLASQHRKIFKIHFLPTVTKPHLEKDISFKVKLDSTMLLNAQFAQNVTPQLPGGGV